MSLKTRLGNLGNVYDQAPSQTKILQLKKPIILNTDLLALKNHFGERATTIDCTYEVEGGWRALRDTVQRIRMEAEDAVREGRGQVILDDRGVSATRAPVPMILATGAVHSHLVRGGASILQLHRACVPVNVWTSTMSAS